MVGGAAQVCDLGVLRAVGDLRRTAPVGTAAYLAPEMIRDGRPSTATDQYALAVSYYELRTGHLPFQASSPEGAYFAHLQGRLVFGRLPAAGGAVLARATAARPEARYPSCSALVDALCRADDGTEDVGLSTRHPLLSCSAPTPTEIVGRIEPQRPRSHTKRSHRALAGVCVIRLDGVEPAISLARQIVVAKDSLVLKSELPFGEKLPDPDAGFTQADVRDPKKAEAVYKVIRERLAKYQKERPGGYLLREAPEADLKQMKIMVGHLKEGQFITKFRKIFTKSEMDDDLLIMQAKLGNAEDRSEYEEILPTSPP
jgi:serine/threonine protein kinase